MNEHASTKEYRQMVRSYNCRFCGAKDGAPCHTARFADSSRAQEHAARHEAALGRIVGVPCDFCGGAFALRLGLCGRRDLHTICADCMGYFSLGKSIAPKLRVCADTMPASEKVLMGLRRLPE